MATIEQEFVRLWNAGVKYSAILDFLDCEPKDIERLKRKTKVKPRRDVKRSRTLKHEVWDMVTRRVPIETIMKEKDVTETYISQVINKNGYSIRDFYEKPKKVKKNPFREDGKVECCKEVMEKCIYGTHDSCIYCVIEQHRRPCPANECTCFKQRPEKFKQRSFL